MERTRRLREIWNWLPAFRAAAETEHLPTAGDQLHVSPSAISRAVRMLEDELGQPLFNREGRALELNEAGERFLRAVRDAMRLVDEGLLAISEHPSHGVVNVSAPRHLLDVLVLPALDRLPREMVVRVYTGDGDEAAALTRGSLDVAVVEDIRPDGALRIEHVGDLSHGVYCGIAHPLASTTCVNANSLGNAAFVASPADQWPLDWTRTIAVHACDAKVAADICARGELLACLPDVLAQGPHAGALKRLAIDLKRRSPVYLASRQPVARHVSTDVTLLALRETLHALSPVENSAST